MSDSSEHTYRDSESDHDADQQREDGVDDDENYYLFQADSNHHLIIMSDSEDDNYLHLPFMKRKITKDSNDHSTHDTAEARYQSSSREHEYYTYPFNHDYDTNSIGDLSVASFYDDDSVTSTDDRASILSYEFCMIEDMTVGSEAKLSYTFLQDEEAPLVPREKQYSTLGEVSNLFLSFQQKNMNISKISGQFLLFYFRSW